jgi:YHS domain-containing protein
VIKILLVGILVLMIARAFWRVVDGILDGARGGQERGGTAVKLVRDPVCGTYVAPTAALSLSAGGTTHYFCSEECRAKYRVA